MKGLKRAINDQTTIKNRFGFRKLSVGLTTVFLGSIFFLAGGQPVHADVNTTNGEQASSKVATADESTSSGQTKSQVNSSEESASKNNNNDGQTTIEDKTNETKSKNELTTNIKPVVDKTSDAEKQLEVSAIAADVQAKTEKSSNQEQVASQNESGKTNSVTSTVTATTPDGKAIDPNGTTQLEEQNNPLQINVKVDANRVASFNNSTFDINFGDTGDSATDGKSWIMQNYSKGETTFIDDNHNYQLTYNGGGDFTVKVLSNSQDAESAGFNQSFTLLGAKANETNGKTILPVTIKYNDKVISEEQFAANIVPVDRSIKHNEIAHIFTHGLTNDSSQFVPTNEQTDSKGYKYNSTSKKLQYIVEWNWGENNPLENVSFQQLFSDGQILLPDTIKVFRVYGDQLTNPDGSRKLDLSENGIYGPFESATGLFANEDTAFENYLKNHMYHTGEGTDTQIQYSDFVNAKNNNQSIPVVNEIKFSENGKFGDGTNDWSKNGGPDGNNDTNTAVHNPHSTFLIQLDTLLSTNMPASWIRPGNGPSSTVTIPNDPNAVVTSDSTNGTSTFNGFNNNGNGGFMNDAAHTARLHFADVTDHNNIVDLGNTTYDGVSIPESLPGANESSASNADQIRFDNVESYINALEQAGYTFVGVSNGATNTTGGHYDSSTVLYSSSTYDGTRYGNYDWERKEFTLNFVKLASQNKSISDSVKYIYENGPKRGQEVETEYAEPKSQTLSFTQKQTVGNDENVVYPTTWKVSTGSAGAFDQIVIPTDVNGNAKYGIDFDNITLNGDKLSLSDSNVSVDKNTHTITITVDKDTVADGTHFDLVVPYKLTENITVHYIDEKENKEINHALNNNVNDQSLNTSYSGDPESTTDNLTKTTIDYLTGLGYVFDEGATNGGSAHLSMKNYDPSSMNFVDINNHNSYDANKLTFDNDENQNNQVYYVYFYHNIQEDKSQTQQKQIDETIHYVDENDAYDDQGNLKDLADSYNSNTLTFTRDANVDQVTGNVDSWNNWSTGTFDAKANANIPHYTVDLNSNVLSQKLNGTDAHLTEITTDQVGSINVFANEDAQKAIEALPEGTSHIEVVVPYKLTENIYVHYIDEDAKGGSEINNVLNNKVDDSKLHTSYSGDRASSTINLTNDTIKYLEGLGYTLDISATNGGTAHTSMKNYDPSKLNFVDQANNNSYDGNNLTFDSDKDPNNQVYYVYLYHAVKEDKTKTQQKQIDEVIHYVDENDAYDDQGDLKDLAKSYTSNTLTFTRDANVDQVTGNVVSWNDWSTGDFTAEKNATVPNYTVDLNSNVLSQKLNGRDEQLTDITTDQVGAISTFENQKAIEALPNGKSHIEIVVPYKITENIYVHYIDEDANGGSEINSSLNNKVDDQQLHTSYSGDPKSTTGNLTNDTIKYLEGLGYILDIDATNGGTAHTSMKNYDPSKLNFVDQANNNSYDGNNFTFDSDKDPNNQVYYVYLYHTVKEDKTKTQQKQIDEVIHYVDEDTSKDIADPYTSSALTFTRDANVDQVTGEVIGWNNWTTGTFDARKNAVVPGYTVDLNSNLLSQKLNGNNEQLAEITADQVGVINTFANENAQKAISDLPDGISHIEIIVPYKKVVTPTPDTPTEPNTPEPPKTVVPDNPTPKPETPPVVPDVPIEPVQPNDNNVPVKPNTPNTPNNNDHDNTVKVHGEDVDKENKHKNGNSDDSIRPLGTSVSKDSSNVHSTNGKSVNSEEHVVETNVKVKQPKVTLPQTGETNNSKLGVIGLGLALVGSILGLAYRKRKE